MYTTASVFVCHVAVVWPVGGVQKVVSLSPFLFQSLTKSDSKNH